MNSKQMMMVGYNDASKAYRVFDPASRKCFIRRDIVFKENTEADDLIIFSEAEKRNVDESKPAEPVRPDDLQEKPALRNPRVPIPRDPYPLRTRLPSASSENEIVESKIAEALLSVCEPQTLHEAMEAEDSAEWIRAIHEELASLDENLT